MACTYDRATRRRFWSQVSTQRVGCWEWQGGTSERYGGFRVDGRKDRTHRVAYRMARGEIPAGQVVRHRCDNRLCVRPSHLVLGTHRENARDSWERGRVAVGDRHGQAKLSYLKAGEIRARYAEGESSGTLAREFGVAPSTICSLIQGRTWAYPPKVA